MSQSTNNHFRKLSTDSNSTTTDSMTSSKFGKGAFTKAELTNKNSLQNKPTRNIARETVTITSGSKLKAAIEAQRPESKTEKIEAKPVHRIQSKLPTLKRDSTYIVPAQMTEPQRILSNNPAPKAIQPKNLATIKSTKNAPENTDKKSIPKPVTDSKSSLSKYSNLSKISPEDQIITEQKNTTIKKTEYKPIKTNTVVEDNTKPAASSQQPLSKYPILTKASTLKKTEGACTDNKSEDQNMEAKKSTEEPLNKSKPSLSAIKQQKRNEIKKLNESLGNDLADSLVLPVNSFKTKNPAEMLTNGKSIETIIDNARRSGQLNLSDQNLNEVPKKVWLINEEKFEDKKSNGLSMDHADDEYRWWQQTELQKLIMASNSIKVIPKDIKNLLSLHTLDVHDNKLEKIDDAIGELSNLQTLNLSHNNLATLPNGICKLSYLKTINLSNNKIAQLPKNFGHLNDLEELNLCQNSLVIIPKSFGWLSKLRKLDLSKNSIKILIPELFCPSNLVTIDLSENQIVSIPEEVGELMQLERLSLRQNKIAHLVLLKKCCKLKDWDISFNKLTEIDEDLFDNLVSLVNFNLRDNQLNSLPKSIKALQTLERLDLSNNNLSNLPAEMATIEPLKQILLAGNPLRAIRKDIVNRGTVAIIKHLRNQLTEIAAEENKSNERMAKTDMLGIVKSTKVYDLSSKKLTAITSDMISFCQQCTAVAFNASRNQLTDLPDEMALLNDQLNELNLSINKFTQVPQQVFMLTSLTTLDLRGNSLTFIPNEIRFLTALRELSLSDNRLTEISPGIYSLPILENLFVNNNRVNTIDALKIIEMRYLSTLHLQNNDLAHIPIELGKAIQLKSLPLDGNPFRLPTHRILAKGTPAVLEYLRGRMIEGQ